MDNGMLSIYLNRLNNASVEVVRGKECVVIPVNDNNLFISSKGTIVLTTLLLKMKESKWGKTHSIQAHIKKEERDKMSEEQRKEAAKELGYFKPFEDRGNAERQNNNPSYNSAPRASATPAATTTNSATNNGDDLEDMPF